MKDPVIIGKGMTSEIFSWENNKVLKLFYADFNKDAVEYEACIAEQLNGFDLTIPAYHGKMEYKGRTGLIYDRINGKELMQLMFGNMNKMKNITRRIAAEQIKINRTKVHKSISSQKERLGNMIGLSKDKLGPLYARVMKILEDMPDQYFLCHGDYHPGNIMVQDNDYIAIDWMNAYAGDPLGDAARTYLMFASPFLPEGIPFVLRIITGIIKPALGRIYRKEYLKLSGRSRREFDKWVPVIAAARLIENLPGEEKWLLAIIKKHVE